MVKGPKALPFLQWITSNDASSLGPGRMQYSTLPAEDGGLIDDIIVTRLQESYLVVVNAVNASVDLDWMAKQAGAFGVQVSFLEKSMLALQGPASQKILDKLGPGLAGLGYYHMAAARLAGLETLVSRSGYTGEDGFEISVELKDALALWEKIMEAGAGEGLVPVGLGARNTLRLEMGYALYGHEIDRTTNPLEAGLGWVTRLDKGDFIGRQAMVAAKEKGLRRSLAGFEMTDKGVARDGYKVLDTAGNPAGHVTSGAPSPTLSACIGMAYLPPSLAAPGSEILVQVRDKSLKARVVKRPFVQPHVRKNNPS
jgi:aminomethyltransferase